MNTLLAQLDNFHFIWPWLGVLVLLPWFVVRLLKPASQPQKPLIAPHLLSRLNQIPNKTDLILTAGSARFSLLWLIIWLLVILAAMRPVWFLTPTPFESSGRDMMLSVDLSGSMEKPDMIVQGREVDRLTALKSVVDEFIAQRQGDRIGLIVFGTQAFMVSPLTYDLNAIRRLLSETAISMAGNNTALGDSIGLAIKHLKQANNQKAVLVLLTDGSNNAGAVDPIVAAQKAAEAGLVIHTIAFGQVGNQNGNRDIDTQTLQTIAELTGGEAFMASQTDQLARIYQRINEIESSHFTLNQYRARTELYIWPLGLALMLSFYLAWQRTRTKKHLHSGDVT
ncbi:VWA domain-containing protein [Thiomicrospira pelophila]|uniref:VWA domain-containing protein n=1 Tax=Thiomicrospira pelophila TaxID=934 RepID=UPI00056ECF9E|nr:VWA domain-containing protein [Thiomicrospira pelophila]